MKLRFIALVSWPLAILFTVYLAPSFDASHIKELTDNHASANVSFLVESDIEKSFAFGSEISQVRAKITSPQDLSGNSGIIQLGQTKVSKGNLVTAIVTFRPSHRNDLRFKGTLKHLIRIDNSRSFDFFENLRGRFLENLKGVTPDSAALVAGLSIGDDSKLSQTVKDDFKSVSLTHLTAVSGANCAIVLAALSLILLRIPIRRGLRIGLSLVAIGAYLALVGPQPSVLRASVMVAVVLIGLAFGRKVSPLDAISLSVILLLVFEPWLSLDYGFALSVLATLGLLVLAPRLTELFENRMPSWLALLVAVTVSAQIACLPVLLMLQPTIPLYSVLANLLAEPLVVPITILGLLACLTAPVIPSLASSICFLASLPASVVISVAQYLAKAPLAKLNWFGGTVGIAIGLLVTGSITVFLLARTNALKVLSGFTFSLIALVFFAQNSSAALTNSNFYSQPLTIINCDVGQGDALVIRSKAQVAVIDVGREDPAIDSCLSNLGVSRIDLLVLTHFDMDHIGGVMGAITGREVLTAMVTSYPDNRPGADFAERALSARQIPIVRAEKGMTGNLGSFSWQVLSPHRGAPEAEDSNDGSITMLWEDDQIALLTLADLGEKGQLRIGSEQPDLFSSGFGSRFVIVKVAHHGSADQAAEFYEAIKPKLALISVGAHNSYGHPTSRALRILEGINAQILRTDQMGALGVVESKDGLSVMVSGRS